MSAQTFVVATFDNPVEANIARTQLEEHDIPCHLDDENIVSNHPMLGSAMGGVKLMVRDEDADQAAEILEEGFGSIIDEEWDEFDVDEDRDDALVSSTLVCPECGSREIGFGKAFFGYWSVVLLLFAASIAFGSLDAGLAASIGFFVGLWLLLFRVFGLQCRDCGARGRRKHFQGNDR